jgi:hypothetical protein
MQARLVVIMLCCATVATAQGFGRSLLTTNTTNITTTNGTIANVTKPLTPQEIQKEIQTEVCASNTIADPLKHLITNTEVSIPLYSMGLIYAFLALGASANTHCSPHLSLLAPQVYCVRYTSRRRLTASSSSTTSPPTSRAPPSSQVCAFHPPHPHGTINPESNT